MMKYKKKSVKFSLIFIFLNSTLNATPLKSPVSETSVKEIIKNSSWKLKLQEAISKNPEFLYQGYELRQAEQRAKQTSNYWLPYINLYGTKVSDQNQRSLAQTTLGLEANLNLFSFGKSYYLGQSSDAGFESQKLLFATQSIAKENELLGMVFNDVYLRNKLSFYVEIENLKKKSLNPNPPSPPPQPASHRPGLRRRRKNFSTLRPTLPLRIPATGTHRAVTATRLPDVFRRLPTPG